MKKGKFIVIEGLDGCGKSTISRKLAGILNSKLLNALPSEVKSWIVDIGNTKLPEATFSYFTLCNILKVKEIKKLLNKGENVILDRYFYTTYVYHKQILNNLPEGIKDIYKDMLNPDLVVFLDVPQSIRKERIEKRKGELQWYGDAISLRTDLTNNYLDLFSELKVKTLIVDNFKNNIEQSVDFIVKHIV